MKTSNRQLRTKIWKRQSKIPRAEFGSDPALKGAAATTFSVLVEVVVSDGGGGADSVTRQSVRQSGGLRTHAA